MLKIGCIPAFNEESTISDVVKRSLSHVDKVIVCDDGSSDNTVSNAEEAGAIVISHKKNFIISNFNSTSCVCFIKLS